MRIKKVTAHAFGPLLAETLDFSEGMTVVAGDNESAKSTWHAAIYAALCGRRRGKGRPREDEQRFADLHQPWDRGDWLVSAEILLDDGRRVELRQDLAGKVDCHAKDLDLGLDLSAEVMNEGTPDAARWLGLDRSSFMATACVEQAQMLRVRTEADGLQQHLQRAATTAAADATAAAALAHIAAFERDHVGLDRANSTKPLRRVREAVQDADRRLAAAQHQHQEYLGLAEKAEQLRDIALCATAMVRAHEAAAAAWRATELGNHVSRADQLHAEFGDEEPPTIADDDATAQQVVDALADWRNQPPETALAGPTADQLRAQIAALPPMPDGDLAVHDSVQDALDRLLDKESQLKHHEAYCPTPPSEGAATTDATDSELLDLARTLESPRPEVDAGLIAQEEAARKDLESAGGQTRTAGWILAGAALLIVAGAGLLTSVGLVPGVALLAIGVGLAGIGVARRRSGGNASAIKRHAAAEAQLNEAKRQTAAAAAKHDDAVKRCAQLGLEPRPSALRAVVSTRGRAEHYAQDFRKWSADRHDLQGQVAAAAGALASALSGRGCPTASTTPEELITAVQQYRTACRNRAEQADLSRARDTLQARLDARQQDEQRAEEARTKRAEAAQTITDAVASCGLPPDSPAALAAALESWLSERREQIDQAGEAQRRWAELQALLNGRTLGQLKEEADAAEQHAKQLAASADPMLLAEIDPEKAAEYLPELRNQANEASTEAATQTGELNRFAQLVTSIAEAEETVEAANAEVARINELQDTLTLTRRFLQDAQTRVHRTIAPVLQATLSQWLPAVTAGRYADVTVNPVTLQVEVCGPSRRWRKADTLSYGTAEQIYLLLRIALADHLTKGHDSCPLILDDVTVHADAERTHQILNLLLKMAEDRQVIIFTQEEQVTKWAEEQLTDTRHTIHKRLPVPAI